MKNKQSILLIYDNSKAFLFADKQEIEIKSDARYNWISDIFRQVEEIGYKVIGHVIPIKSKNQFKYKLEKVK